MCNIWREKLPRVWTANSIKSIIMQKAFVKHTEVVNITGGEPTLNPDFFQIFSIIVGNLKKLTSITLQTNGINSGKIVSALKPCIDLLKIKGNIHFDINISLDGNEVIHEKIRGVKGSWKSVMQTAKECVNLTQILEKHNVTFNCTIVKQNVRLLSEIKKIADDMNIDITYTFPQITDVFMNNTTTTSYFSIERDDVEILTKFLEELSTKLSGSSVMSSRYCSMLIKMFQGEQRNIGCPLVNGGIFIDSAGDVYPCWKSSSLYSGNITTDGIEKIIQVRSSTKYKTNLLEECKNCTSNCYIDWNRRQFASKFKTISEYKNYETS
jgi:MoaA/NifB/PqqE/SkfB family radical SAM enzyme